MKISKFQSFFRLSATQIIDYLDSKCTKKRDLMNGLQIFDILFNFNRKKDDLWANYFPNNFFLIFGNLLWEKKCQTSNASIKSIQPNNRRQFLKKSEFYNSLRKLKTQPLWRTGNVNNLSQRSLAPQRHVSQRGSHQWLRKQIMLCVSIYRNRKLATVE